MALARKYKISLSLTLFVLAVIVGGLGLAVYYIVQAFSVEDRIHATFFPVATGLYQYEDDHKHPADSLAELVPQYLSAIPSSPLADSIHYKVSADGKSWELAIHSRA